MPSGRDPLKFFVDFVLSGGIRAGSTPFLELALARRKRRDLELRKAVGDAARGAARVELRGLGDDPPEQRFLVVSELFRVRGQKTCRSAATARGTGGLQLAEQLHAGVSYWVDADPRWPGVYYAKISGGCPYGGSGTGNCHLLAFPGDLLETGVVYVVHASTDPATIYYTPDFD